MIIEATVYTVAFSCVKKKRLEWLNENDMCLGCGRMLGEITSWVSFSEQKRADVMTQCQNRLQALKTWKPGLVDQKK